MRTSFAPKPRYCKIPIVVQARMSSSRLPGKVLMPFGHREPLLGCIIDRLRRSVLADGLIVATSTDPTDDPIEAFCAHKEVACLRGPLNNVALRFKQLVEHFQSEAFVRICGDSPFIDASLVDLAISKFIATPVDLVTNTFRRTFPKGLSVQVMRSETFLREFDAMQSSEDREHVLSYFQQRPNQFSILNFESADNLADINLCIDEPSDAARLAAIAARLTEPLARCNWHVIASTAKQS